MEENFECKFFVKEIDYRGTSGGEITVGIKLLDFPVIFITPADCNDNDSKRYSKGKLCRFSMTRPSLIQLLQRIPYMVQVSFIGRSSHDRSHDQVLATGLLNDGTTWCSRLSSTSSDDPSLILNESYMIHLTDNNRINMGYVIIKIKLYIAADHSTDVATGQYDIRCINTTNTAVTTTTTTNATKSSFYTAYLPNVWFPPPLYFTAHSVISDDETSDGGRYDNNAEMVRTDNDDVMLCHDMTSLHWEAIVKDNINSWPWKGYEPPNCNIILDTTHCTSHQHAKKSNNCVSSTSGGLINHKSFPILSALCKEISLLDQTISSHPNWRNTCDKEVQTEPTNRDGDDDEGKREERKKSSEDREIVKQKRKLHSASQKRFGKRLVKNSTDTDESTDVDVERDSRLNTSSRSKVSHELPVIVSSQQLSPSSSPSPPLPLPSQLPSSPSSVQISHHPSLQALNNPKIKVVDSLPSSNTRPSSSSQSTTSINPTHQSTSHVDKKNHSMLPGTSSFLNPKLLEQKVYLAASLQSLGQISNTSVENDTKPPKHKTSSLLHEQRAAADVSKLELNQTSSSSSVQSSVIDTHLSVSNEEIIVSDEELLTAYNDNDAIISINGDQESVTISGDVVNKDDSHQSQSYDYSDDFETDTTDEHN